MLRSVSTIHRNSADHAKQDDEEEEELHQLQNWMRSHRTAIEQLLTQAEEGNEVLQAKHVVDILAGSATNYRPWDIIFEQREPEIESLTLTAPSASTTSSDSSSLSWIDWFDRLQASVSAMEQML